MHYALLYRNWKLYFQTSQKNCTLIRHVCLVYGKASFLLSISVLNATSSLWKYRQISKISEFSSFSVFLIFYLWKIQNNKKSTINSGQQIKYKCEKTKTHFFIILQIQKEKTKYTKKVIQLTYIFLKVHSLNCSKSKRGPNISQQSFLMTPPTTLHWSSNSPRKSFQQFIFVKLCSLWNTDKGCHFSNFYQGKFDSHSYRLQKTVKIKLISLHLIYLLS